MQHVVVLVAVGECGFMKTAIYDNDVQLSMVFLSNLTRSVRQKDHLAAKK